jgi:hypothetical protein
MSTVRFRLNSSSPSGPLSAQLANLVNPLSIAGNTGTWKSHASVKWVIARESFPRDGIERVSIEESPLLHR